MLWCIPMSGKKVENWPGKTKKEKREICYRGWRREKSSMCTHIAKRHTDRLMTPPASRQLLRCQTVGIHGLQLLLDTRIALLKRQIRITHERKGLRYRQSGSSSPRLSMLVDFTEFVSTGPGKCPTLVGMICPPWMNMIGWTKLCKADCGFWSNHRPWWVITSKSKGCEGVFAFLWKERIWLWLY